MKTRLIVSTIIASVAMLGASAQTTNDLLRFSQYNYSFGTARSAAMGGAFTSLGADLSSMNINPAGLGMYRSSEIGITPILSGATMKSSFGGAKYSDTKTKLTLGNFGAALNLYQGSGALTSFTFGFGYNKLVDYNTSSLSRGYGQPYSMMDYFSSQLQGIPVDNITGNYPNKFSQYPDKWGAILAYESYLVDPNDDPGLNSDYIPAIHTGTTLNRIVRNNSKGSVGEYTFSGGLNFGNMIYFGASIGMQDIYFENTNSYYEEVADSEVTENLLNYTYRKRLVMSGTGVNAKLGITLRPARALRIGVAVHTPTYIMVNDQYVEDIKANYRDSSEPLESPANVWDYAIVTPTRMLAGISYAFPYGIISADYERVWYDGIRIKETDDVNYEDEMNSEVRDVYRPADNFRAGIEVTPGYGLFVRGGVAFYGDMMSNSNLKLVGEQVVKSYNSYSGGLGYRFGSVSVDLSYVNTHYKYLDYDYWQTYADVASGTTRDKLGRHSFILTTSLRF